MTNGDSFYEIFIHRSRWLSDEAMQRRTVWFDGLEVEDKSSLLFQFEVLLKGLISLGNVRNYPGTIANRDLSERDFSGELQMFLDAVSELLEIGNRLNHGSPQAKGAFSIELFASSTADDFLRTEHMERNLHQDTPEKSLAVLLGTLQLVQTLCESALQKKPVVQREFVALHIILFREVVRSTYFNMLTLFEFRAQYDEILRHQVLLTLDSIDHVAAQRISSISLLTIFRLMNYLDLTARWEGSHSDGALYALLCLIYSDSHQFAQFLANDTIAWISNDFGDEFESLPPTDLLERYDELNLQFQELKSLRELLESTGNQLALELKKTFAQQLPTVEELETTESLYESVRVACDSLRSFLQNAVVLLVQEFNVSVVGDDLFEDFSSDATRSGRLRRDIWMFKQILKAFVVKVSGTESVRDRWIGLNTFKFVRTFVEYFRSMGYQLLRYSDYDRFDKFMALVDRLRDGDVLEVQRLSHVVAECEAFYLYLEEMFETVEQRDELQNIPFDPKDAARTLKLFIA